MKNISIIKIADKEIYEIVCPKCKEEFTDFHDVLPDTGEYECPKCKNIIQFKK